MTSCFLPLLAFGVRRNPLPISVMWLMRIPPTATPPNLTDGSLYSVMLRPIGCAILAPSGNQNSAHRLAWLIWASVIALVVNDDRLFGAVSALDCGHGDRDAGADDVIGVELVALGENRIRRLVTSGHG